MVDLFGGDAPGARHTLAQGGGAEGVTVIAFAGCRRHGLGAEARGRRARCCFFGDGGEGFVDVVAVIGGGGE